MPLMSAPTEREWHTQPCRHSCHADLQSATHVHPYKPQPFSPLRLCVPLPSCPPAWLPHLHDRACRRVAAQAPLVAVLRCLQRRRPRHCVHQRGGEARQLPLQRRQAARLPSHRARPQRFWRGATATAAASSCAPPRLHPPPLAAAARLPTPALPPLIGACGRQGCRQGSHLRRQEGSTRCPATAGAALCACASCRPRLLLLLLLKRAVHLLQPASPLCGQSGAHRCSREPTLLSLSLPLPSPLPLPLPLLLLRAALLSAWQGGWLHRQQVQQRAEQVGGGGGQEEGEGVAEEHLREGKGGSGGERK